MKSRRWFSGPKLIQWKTMVADGNYEGPFATFPQPQRAALALRNLDVDSKEQWLIESYSGLNCYIRMTPLQ